MIFLLLNPQVHNRWIDQRNNEEFRPGSVSAFIHFRLHVIFTFLRLHDLGTGGNLMSGSVATRVHSEREGGRCA